jgi:transcriptional regulator with XRE-family HTH domain
MTDSTTRQAVAELLRKAREQAGLSQGQAAKLMDLHRPTISEIEAGRRRVSAEELAAFAKLYGVSVAWLAGAGQEQQMTEDVALAARQLERLRPEDRQRVLDLIRSFGVKDQ